MNISARLLTDTLMLLLLLLLMADRHTGNMAHEWLGVLLLTAILLHAWLNRTWFSTLRKGKYTLFRSIRLILNGLLFIFITGTLASAVIISQTVFAFAGFKGELFFRTIHVFCAHWSFLLSAMHLGLYGTNDSATLSDHRLRTSILKRVAAFSSDSALQLQPTVYTPFSKEN